MMESWLMFLDCYGTFGRSCLRLLGKMIRVKGLETPS